MISALNPTADVGERSWHTYFTAAIYFPLGRLSRDHHKIGAPGQRSSLHLCERGAGKKLYT